MRRSVRWVGLASAPTRRRFVRAVAIVVVAAAGCAGGDSDKGGDQPRPGDGQGSGSVGPAAPGDVAPAPSAGCGTSGAMVGETTVTLTSGGVERRFIQHIPPAHDGDTPVPLVVDLHGYSEGAEAHSIVSQLGPFGDEHGFVTVTPHGRGRVPFWDASSGGPDVAFIDDLLDHVEESLCLDTRRIYATGLSNGAMMASTLACVAAARFAAVAPVAGITRVDPCAPDRPVPVVSFHGTDDQFLSYGGGLGPAVANLPAPDGQGTIGDVGGETDDVAGTAPSVPEVMAEWARRNGCDRGDPTEQPVAEDVTLLTFPCPEDAAAELYRVEGGGHSWPGSELLKGAENIVGRTTTSISANEVMWEFFEAHPLRSPS